MIKIENVEVIGWKHAIRGMRNPMNSWEKSDTDYCFTKNCNDITCKNKKSGICLGENDLDLMMRLRNAGTDHRKFMRMIVVYLDITAPLYWWKEYSTYKVGTVANSCSTMHKIHERELTLDDFSHEHLTHYGNFEDETWADWRRVLSNTINNINYARKRYLETKDKKYWWQMIQLLPSSYNQKRTIMLNYEVLANIYKSRKDHKLDEWRVLCKRIEELPYSNIITGER